MLTVATPIIAAVALIFSANHGFWIDRLQQFEARDVPRLGAVAQCNDPTWNPALDPVRCQFNVEQPGRVVYLIGDSYAEVLGDPLAEAARREGRPFGMKSYGGCPAVLSHVGSWPTRTENSPNCSLVVRESLDWLSESPPGTVVIANAEYYVRDPNIDMWRGSGITAQRATDKVTAFTAGLSAVVDELRKTGHDIIVVQPIPNFRLDTDRVTQERWNGVTECATIRVLTNTCLTSAPESLAEITKRQSGLWNAISGLATRESLTIVDVRDHLCPSGLCAVQQGDTLMFREYLHLTVDGAKTLTPFMIEALRASDELRG